MPEGDTIHHAARCVRGALVGSEIQSIETPNPHRRLDRWPERLVGREVRSVDAHGKHLFLRFEGDLTLMTESPSRFDQRLAALGPDILAGELDEAGFLRRRREDDPTRGIGDALLDQRNLAGIGSIWKSESCFLARVDPWRKAGAVSDDEALAIVRGARPLMQASAERGGHTTTFPGDRPGATWVYERQGLPCRRCQALVRARGQGDDNRTTFWCPGTTFWCPGCQA